jgi:hypothetical protein
LNNLTSASMVHRVYKLLLLAALLFLPLVGSAQTPTASPTPSIAPGTADEKSQQIIDRAVEHLGGPAYLRVRTVTGKGFYTAFSEGVSQIPAKFLDYLVYPDRERTEFSSGGIKTIQTNAGDTGWLFDGAVKTITDQSQTQVDEFKRGMRTSLENLLRGWWRKEDGKVSYVGRREAGLAKRNETLRLTYPNGFWVEYEFGARDGMPAKIIYKRSRKNLDSGDVEETTEEDQLLKPISIDGITAPWVVDHFVNGKQTSRINYESIQYNQTLSDSLFAKPDNIKSIK